MQRHTVSLWARLLLPLGTTLPIGCEMSTSNLPSPQGTVNTRPELAGVDETQWPLRRTAPPQIVPVDYAGPFGSVEVLPSELGSSPLRQEPVQKPAARGPAFAAPVNEPGPQFVPSRGRWTETLPPSDAMSPAGAPVTPDAELLPPFGSSEDREVQIPGTTGEQAAAPVEAEPAPEPFVSTEIPWARPIVRSPEFQAILKRAQDLNLRAFELASRGANYSAQARFAESLYLVATALDSQQDTQVHSKALALGLKALDEAADFAPPGGANRRELDVAGLIAHHRTSILKETPGEVTALAARQRYYTYAQEQLAMAGGQEFPSSEALFGLGKLALATKASPKEPTNLEAMARAMVCYQASLMCDPNNFRSSNELGVLMVHAGRLEHARELFVRSVAAAPHPSTLQNLAVVYQQLGDPAAAAQTRSQADRLAKSIPATEKVPVKWVDSATFNSTASTTDGLHSPPATAAPVPTAAPAKQAAEPKATTAKKSNWDWLPWR